MASRSSDCNLSMMVNGHALLFELSFLEEEFGEEDKEDVDILLGQQMLVN